jgi:hypothetical protein
MALAPAFRPPPYLIWASTAGSCISNSQCVASMSCQVTCTPHCVTFSSLVKSSQKFRACCLTIAVSSFNCLFTALIMFPWIHSRQPLCHYFHFLVHLVRSSWPLLILFFSTSQLAFISLLVFLGLQLPYLASPKPLQYGIHLQSYFSNTSCKDYLILEESFSGTTLRCRHLCLFSIISLSAGKVAHGVKLAICLHLV